MQKSKELIAKIKITDVQIQAYIKELEFQNIELNKKIGKLEAQIFNYQNRIKSITKNKQPIKVNFAFPAKKCHKEI